MKVGEDGDDKCFSGRWAMWMSHSPAMDSFAGLGTFVAHVECARALMGDDVLPLASDVDQSVRAPSRLSCDGRYRRR